MTNVTKDRAAMGEVLRDGDRVGLRFVRQLPHPVERVWSAVTESEQLRFWLPCDIVGERRAGAEVSLPFWPPQVEKYQIAGDERALPGRIEVWEPPAIFQWTWGGDVLRFELEPSRQGTTLTFTTWLESPDRDGAASAAGGYHVCLDELRTVLETGSAPPLEDADAEARRLQAAYAAVLGVG